MQPTPCFSCPKINELDRARTSLAVVELRTFAVELSDRNRQAVTYHRQCLYLGGKFPEDPLVRQHASVIGPILEGFQASKLDRVYFLLGGKL